MDTQNKNSSYYLTIFAVIVLLFSFLNYAHDALKMSLDSYFSDFGNFYYFSSLMANNCNIYQLDLEKVEQLSKDGGFRQEFFEEAVHTPFAHFVLLPFTLLKQRLAALLWFLLDNILFLISIGLLIILIKDRFVLDIPTLTVLFITFTFQPLREALCMGNFYITILFFLVSSLWCLKKDEPVLAGILLAFAAMLKLQFGLLLLFFLWKRKYSVFLSALVTIIVFNIFMIISTGPNLHLSYLEKLRTILIRGKFTAADNNFSIDAFLCRLFNVTRNDVKFNLMFIGTKTFVFFMCLFTAYITKEKRKSTDPIFWLEYALIIVLISIISPVVHEPYYVLLYIPIILFWYKMEIFEPKQKIWIFFILSYLLIGLGYSLIRFPIFQKGILSLLYNGKLYGVVILYLLGVKIIKKIKQQEER